MIAVIPDTGNMSVSESEFGKRTSEILRCFIKFIIGYVTYFVFRNIELIRIPISWLCLLPYEAFLLARNRLYNIISVLIPLTKLLL